MLGKFSVKKPYTVPRFFAADWNKVIWVYKFSHSLVPPSSNDNHLWKPFHFYHNSDDSIP